MSSEQVDYESVLADLEAKRTALDAAISALRQVLSVGANVTVGASGSSSAQPVDPKNIPEDAFFGMSIGEAAKKYLALVKRKQTTKAIAEALDQGGVAHTSKNFLGTVSVMLLRTSRNDEELVRVGRGEWGLSSWYGPRRQKHEPSPRRRPNAKRASKKRSQKRDDSAA